MTPRGLVLGGAVLGALTASPAAACPEEDARLLFHSCHGAASAELLLLPEEAQAIALPPGRDGLVVTGAYTGPDTRAGGHPNPVGLFVDNGRVVSPNLAPMDGILVIGTGGRPRIHRSTRVPVRDATADLTDPDQRLDFAGWAAERGHSVLQSHLLISDGRLDVRPQLDAPVARRRMLFTGPEGWGVYETAAPVSLFDAAFELQQRYRPDMALNLDMGSFDFCLLVRDGAASDCGLLPLDQTAKLSNLLRFARTAP